MTRFFPSLPVLAIGALLLQACASTGPAPLGKAPKPGKPSAGAMAPIANPVEEPHPAPRPQREPPEPERAPPPRPEPQRQEAPPPKAEPAKPPPPTTKASAVDHQRAAKLRTQGLTRLNGGQVDRAVALLEQAAQLDPDNALIKRDLERARRISHLVHQPK